MQIFNHLNLEFSNPKMETEYTSVRQNNLVRDFTVDFCLYFSLFFQVIAAFLFMINMFVVIPSLIKFSLINLIISMTAIGTIVFSFIIGWFYHRLIQALTICAFFVFIATRIVLVKFAVGVVSGAELYLNGYVLGVVLCIMLIYTHKIQHKIYIVIITYALRIGIIIGVVDPAILSPIMIIRHFLIDLFLIFMFYTNEKTSRMVFRNFYDNRQELMKFKELLADSLPQSVLVVDCVSDKQLFWNDAFKKTFDHENAETCTYNTENKDNFAITIDNGVAKSYFGQLKVDSSTVREVGSAENDFIPLTTSPEIGLVELINKVTQSSSLRDKVLSLTASFPLRGLKKSFEVILKRIPWNRSDAMAIILSDITYQEKIIALKVANVNKDQIIATVSHELRTPLHGIIGLLEVSENKIEDEEVIQNLALCKDNAHLLLGLVNSLLDFHQISTGKLKLNPKRVDIRKTLDGIVRLFQFQCSQKSICLSSETIEDVYPFVNTDENRLKQVLINLVGNAIKFTMKGGVKITASQDPLDEDFVLISVIDTGIGIKEEDKGKLFKMYGKLDDGESVNKNGVGLGLTISNALAVHLNGQSSQKGIGLESKYGEGCTFSFRILKDLNNIQDVGEDLSKEELLQKVRHNPVHESLHLDRGSSEGKRAILSNSCEEVDEYFPMHVGSKIASYTLITRQPSMDLGRAYFPKPFHNTLEKSSLFLKVSTGQDLDETHRRRNSELDALKSHGHRQAQPSLSLSYPSIERGLLLVVDDNPFNLLIARNLIKDLGYVIKTASGGHEALEIVKATHNDGATIKAIFMDCQMPIMDGFETSKTLIEMMNALEIPQIPIIAWTANNSEEDIKRCYQSGMVAHLSKPTSQAAIMKALAKLH